MNVRTRIAPAPSGSLHVGNARTALYNWLFARRHGGSFVLRIDDTDRERATEDAYRAVLEDLQWLGLTWDEGPDIGGDLGPYRQSERGDRYAGAVESLLASGSAYGCYCTPEELRERREKAQAERRPPRYDGRCRDLTEEERSAFEAQGRSSTVRFKVPQGQTVTFEDVVRGAVVTATSEIEDFVIQRSNGSTLYILATAVDDALMGFTHIIRGEDIISSTPRQLLIRAAIGIDDVPVFAHLPLLVGADGKPLSKRHGDVAVGAYRARGILPEAMINYLALLGWGYDDKTTIFSRDDLVSKFSLDRVTRNPAAFDVAKLEWMNGHYMRSLEPAELAERLLPFCVDAGLDDADTEQGRDRLRLVAPLLVDRLKRLDEAPGMVAFLFREVEPDGKAKELVAGSRDYLDAAAQVLEQLSSWSGEEIEVALRALAQDKGLKPKQAFQPIRAAVTGTLVSPPLFESLEILGREASLRRLRRA